MLPILNIGPFAIQLPGLVILIGVWLGLSLAERLTRFITASDLYNLVLISLFFGVVGARLGYVIEHWSEFSDNPLNIFSLNLDMFNFYAGIGSSLIAAIFYGQRKQLNLWRTLDALTPFFAVLLLAIGISHLASGNAFGAPTHLPWSIYLWGTQRHPTQIYEIILSTFTLVLVIIWSRKLLTKIDGILFLGFMALTASTHLFIEAFRGDSNLTIFGIRTAQIVTWLILAISLWAIGKRLAGIKISVDE
jgi:phosphatidylglycerol:prolipoprotein diacylglycerol transferase